jgi:hypothetical protein
MGIVSGSQVISAPVASSRPSFLWLLRQYCDSVLECLRAGTVLSYDGSPDAADSHSNIGPVHEVLYDDGIFYENLTNAHWTLDANEEPSGNAMGQEELDIGRNEDRKGSFEATPAGAGTKRRASDMGASEGRRRKSPNRVGDQAQTNLGAKSKSS